MSLHQKNKKTYLFLVLFTFLICLYSNGKAQGNQPIEVIGADSMNTNLNGEPQRTLFGNVHLRQGATNVYCNKGIFYINLNKADLSGNVRVLEDDMSLEAPNMSYDGNTRISNAYGGVKVSDNSTILTAKRGTYNMNTHTAYFSGEVLVVDDSATIVCDRIIHQRREGYSQAIGNAFVKGRYSNVLLAGDSLSNDKKKNYSSAMGNPILVQIDSTENAGIIKYDTLTIESKVMEAFRNKGNERYNFKDSVSIVRSNVKARAGSSIFWKDIEVIELFESPVVWHDSTQLHADSITIVMQNNKLKKLIAKNKSIACMKDNPDYNPAYINQISGNRIDIIVENEEISEINSFDNAKSLYFIVSENGGEGANVSTADTINITFSDSNPENMIWLGEINGDVVPDPIVFYNPTNYYLPDFKWDELLPKKRELELPVVFKKE